MPTSLKLVTYDNNGKENIAIATAIGDSEDYIIFSIQDHYISADTYHYAASSTLKVSLPVFQSNHVSTLYYQPLLQLFLTLS